MIVGIRTMEIIPIGLNSIKQARSSASAVGDDFKQLLSAFFQISLISVWGNDTIAVVFYEVLSAGFCLALNLTV